MRFKKDILAPTVVGVIGVVGGAVAAYLVTETQETSRLARAESDRRRAYYEQLRFHLDASSAAFQNQITARDALAALLAKNHGPLPNEEFEPLFRRYYPKFNREEKVFCQLMRGITFTSLREHNEAMNRLLRENAKYSAELPEFQALREHLDLWLSKAAAMKEREDTCLVYTGVLEEKPFPLEIGKSVDRLLAEIGAARRPSP